MFTAHDSRRKKINNGETRQMIRPAQWKSKQKDYYYYRAVHLNFIVVVLPITTTKNTFDTKQLLLSIHTFPTMLQSSLDPSESIQRLIRGSRNNTSNDVCSHVTGLRATKVSHRALPFGHHDRCANLAVFLRLDATLRRDPRLHVLG